MDILDHQVAGSSDHALTDKMRELLIITAKWGRFLAIVGFVFIGLLIVLIFSMGTIFSMLEPEMPVRDLESFFMLPFMIIIAIYFFPTLYLYQFSSNTLKAIGQTYDVVRMETAFEKLKSLFKFIGIFTIIILSIYGLSFFLLLLSSGLGLAT